MDAGFGIERPSAPVNTAHDRPAKYLVLIESAGSPVARLFLDDRELVAEFDGGAEEVAMMTRNLVATRSAEGPEWNQALAGHSAAERRAAEIYTLDV